MALGHVEPARTGITLRFTVYGRAIPQGSMRAFIPKGWKRAVITSVGGKKLKSFRQEITTAALVAMQGSGFKQAEQETAVALGVKFYLAKPKSAKKRAAPCVKPDVDKLLRAVLDGLTGTVFHDDAQVVFARAEKLYGEPERVEIGVGIGNAIDE